MTTNTDKSSLPFEEKNAWIQLVTLIAVLVWYSLTFANKLAEGITDITAFAGSFLAAIGLVIVLTIIGHIVAAIMAEPEKRDERDRLIEQRAVRISSHILEGGATLALILLVFGLNPLWPAHLLFLALFLEEIVRHTIMITFYRKGM